LPPKKNLIQFAKYIKFDESPYDPTAPEYQPDYPADSDATAPTDATGTNDGDDDYVAYVLIDNVFSSEDVFAKVATNGWAVIAGAPVDAWDHD